jgi:SRSO17 transposase
MLQAIIQSHASLGNFLSAFREAFRNQPQYRHFQAYVLALLIYLGSRNLAGLSRAIPDGRAACSLYRFVAKMDWDMDQVERTRWDMLNRHTRRALQAAGRHGQLVPIYLAIDDSVVEKTGKQIEGVDYHYAHSVGHTVLGHVWVTGHLVVLGQSYPVSWKLYRRQVTCQVEGVPFASKPALAQAILEAFEPLPGTQVYVLTDSWYPSQDMLNVCQRKGFQFISGVKSNRKFETLDPSTQKVDDRQVQQWVQNLPEKVFDVVTVNTTGYESWSATGRLSSGHRVKVVLNRAIGQTRWRYLISTDVTLTPQTIISYYLVRWEVENFYRLAKQSLGWGDYQMRDLFAIERHVQLMMVAHAYLELQRQEALASAVDPDEHITHGDIQRQLQSHSRRTEIAQVFNLAQRGFTLETIYQHLAA